MLYRVLDRAGRFVGNITTPHGDHMAAVEALANMFADPIAGCIRRAHVQPLFTKPPRLVITPMKANGGPLVRRGRALIYVAIFVHDGGADK